MNVRFETIFIHDLKRIREKKVLLRIKKLIETLEKISCISELRNIKKIHGYDALYRIRLGDYRLGINIIENHILVRILHRKEIYKFFPPK